LLTLLSAPRPNGSQVLKQTVEAVRAWLEREGIPVQSHHFTLHPYFMELLGIWMMLTGLLLPVAALARWGWGGLILALLMLAVPLLEVRLLCPTVTALVRQRAENLVVSFPVPYPSREVIFCAHMDSKTELLDHYQRSVLLRLSVPAMGLALIAGVLTAVNGLSPVGLALSRVEGPALSRVEGPAATTVRWLAFLVALPVTAYGLGMGANLVGGRFSRRPSTGAVDNGAAVAILLALARQLRRRNPHLDHTAVTLLLSVGEEAQMQGALDYVRGRKDWPVPVSVVNLEVLGQNGGYLLWERDGTAMRQVPTDPILNRALERAVEAVTGERPVCVPTINSDAFAFIRRGIPAATLGSFDLDLGGRGLHSALDSPDRVSRDRLVEAGEILSHFLEDADSAATE
jgi:hypothetical protein